MDENPSLIEAIRLLEYIYQRTHGEGPLWERVEALLDTVCNGSAA